MKNSISILLILVCISLFGQVANVDETKEISNLVLLSWCLIGCVLQEFIYWFELRRDIANGNNTAMLKSRTYWIITILGIIIFTGASYFYFSYGVKVTPSFFTTAVFAAGFPRLFKGAVSSVQLPENETTTRRRLAGKFTFRDYLMMK